MSIHQHSHPPRLRRPIPQTREEIAALLAQRGWTPGKKVTASGVKGQFYTHASQQEIMIIEDVATGQIRLFRETMRDWLLVASGKLPPA